MFIDHIVCAQSFVLWLAQLYELWCWRRLLRIPWTARRSNQSILKENSPGISLEGMMLSWNSSTLATSCEELIHWKRPWCWEGLGQEEKGTTEDEMAGWHHWLDGCESEWTPGVCGGQGGLACCDSWGGKESDTTERLNWTELMLITKQWRQPSQSGGLNFFQWQKEDTAAGIMLASWAQVLSLAKWTLT